MIKLPAHWSSMRNSIFSILLCATLLGANEAQDVEVLAETVTKDGNIVHAQKSVVLHSPKYLITADEAYYDYESGDVELFGNITIMEGTNYSSRSGHTKLNLKDDKGTSDPFFLFDSSSDVWLKCENAIHNPDKLIAQKSIVSSCNTQDPDWKITFTTGEFNKESKWMQLYNPVFYANDIPVLYLPYFAFPTDKTRRTGFLRPDFGYGNSEGFYYMQPIYFAPALNWDLEVRPQIRTNRGEGLHQTFRFVDSPYSSGSFSSGYFREQGSYARDEKLKNDSHYGFRLLYDRSELLSTRYKGLEDGLWLDINYLNDIDYYNTMDGQSRAYDKDVISRLNYYVKKDEDYFGIYAKNYIDTSKNSNKDTLQELPVLHYHHFSNPLLLDNLFYSIDYKAKNFERSEGTTAIQNELRTPFSIYFSFFDDYLKLSASENIYMSYASYGNESENGNYGKYFNNYHRFSAYTDLSKAYDSFFHTVYFGVEHTVPSYRKQEGAWNYMYKESELIPLEMEEKSTAFKFKQFFYDMNGEKRFSHSVKQAYYQDRDNKYGDLENDIKYYISDRVYIGDTIHYSHEFNKISRNQISLSYRDDFFAGSLRHTIVDKSYDHNRANKNFEYLTISVETSYFEHLNLFASANYDMEESEFKSWTLGAKKIKKCWDYSIVYKDVMTPKQTSAGADSSRKKGVMLMFNLYPLGSINYEFAKETDQKIH